MTTTGIDKPIQDTWYQEMCECKYYETRSLKVERIIISLLVERWV